VNSEKATKEEDMTHRNVIRELLALLVTTALTVGYATAGQLRLRITKPEPGAAVVERPFVEGTVSDPNAEVWVIVHPMEMSEFWVQPAVTVKEDGTWKVQIYIGRSGGSDVGKYFEIMAVASPRTTLKEGKLERPGWPKGEAKSQVVEVTRAN
jgi:hypothetical protein